MIYGEKFRPAYATILESVQRDINNTSFILESNNITIINEGKIFDWIKEKIKSAIDFIIDIFKRVKKAIIEFINRLKRKNVGKQVSEFKNDDAKRKNVKVIPAGSSQEDINRAKAQSSSNNSTMQVAKPQSSTNNSTTQATKEPTENKIVPAVDVSKNVLVNNEYEGYIDCAELSKIMGVKADEIISADMFNIDVADFKETIDTMLHASDEEDKEAVVASASEFTPENLYKSYIDEEGFDYLEELVDNFDPNKFSNFAQLVNYCNNNLFNDILEKYSKTVKAEEILKNKNKYIYEKMYFMKIGDDSLKMLENSKNKTVNSLNDLFKNINQSDIGDEQYTSCIRNMVTSMISFMTNMYNLSISMITLETKLYNYEVEQIKKITSFYNSNYH